MASRSLTIDIRTADAQTIAALKKIQKELRDTGTTADRTSKSGLSLGQAFAGVAVGAGIKSAADSASNLAEAQSKVNVVFGESAPLVERFGESSSTAIGQSEAQALEAVGTFGNLLRAIGLTEQQSADYSITLTKLASDLASFNNTSVDEAITALRSGLSGETEPLKRFGVNLNEAALKAQALKMGLSDGKAVLDANAKAQAAYALILEQTTLAQGDFERTSDGVANKQRILAAEFENSKAKLGEALMPAFEGGVDVLTKFADVAGSIPQPLQQAALAAGALAIVGPKVAEGWASAAESIGTARGSLRGSVSDFGLAKSAAAGAATGLTAYNVAYAALQDLAKSDVNVSALTDDLELLGKGQSDAQPILDQYGGSIESLTQKIKDLNAATSRGIGENAWEALNQDGFDPTAYGRDVNQLKNELGDLDQALAQLAKNSPKEAEEAYRQLAVALLNSGATGEDLMRVFPLVNAELDRNEKRTKGATKATEEHADAIAKVESKFQDYVSASDAVAAAGEAVNDAIVGVAEARDKVADAERGVADAQEAVADANQAVADARRGVEDAERGVADALKGVETAQRGVTDAEEAAVDAREAVTEATEAWVRAAADAERGSEFLADAEERVARSQEDSRLAQEALTQARRDYGATMQELATDVAAATDDVTLGQIAIDEAKKRLAELMADPEATANERKRAEIAVREAERRLAELEQRLKETQETFDRNNAGVEASDAVREAHERADEAAQNQQDAEESLADAQEEANRRVAAAQDSLTEAIDRRRDADQRVLDAKQAVVDANDRVRDAVRGVEDANRRVADAVGNVADAQQRVTDAKEAVKTARGEVEQAERDVEKAVRDQYDAYQDLAELFAPGSAARTRMEWLTGQLREQFTYLNTPGPANSFLDQLWGRSAPGGKGGGVPDGKPSRGATTPAAPAVPAGPETRPGGWVRQPNGRWWRPRKPGEANYGDGYVDQAEMLRMIQAEEAAKAPKPDTALKPAAAEITVNVIGADDPATTAERVSKRLGWEITRLIGSAA